MASTNKTTNLELSQFLGSDSPKWLTDYNADMQKIDTAVGSVQSQSDATDLIVSGHTAAIEALQTTTGEQGTAITALRTDVNHNSGDISTINSLIGNGEPTTTDKTIIGAINELNSEMPTVLSNYDVIDINHSISANADGTKTWSDIMFTDLVTAFRSYVTSLASDEIIQITGFDFGDTQLSGDGSVLSANSSNVNLRFTGINFDVNNTFLIVIGVLFASGGHAYTMKNNTTTDIGASVPTSTQKATIKFNVYKARS